MFRRLLIALVAATMPALAQAQSSPSFSYGQVPTAGQWNAAFASKQDRLTFTPLNRAGDTMAGKLQAAPSTVNGAGFSLLPGMPPSSPSEGDLWVTGGNIYARLNGQATVLAPRSDPTFAGTTTVSKLAIISSGSTGPVDGMWTTAPDGPAIARALSTRLRDLPVYPQDYWTGNPTQFCDGATDVSSAYRAAANVAMSTSRALHLGGPSLCVIGSTIPIQGALPLVGDGPSRSVLVGIFNGPIFTWDTDGPSGGPAWAESSYAAVGGFTLRGQYGADTDYSASRGFIFTGGNANYFQYNRFRGIVFESLYAAFEIKKGTNTTQFGQESAAAWLSFEDITIRGGSRPAMYGWIWDFGSGTGTTYSSIKTSMTSPDSAVFYYKSGVVGDIVINSGHFGGSPGQLGAPGSKLIKVDSGTVYRSNILVSGSQLDAGMDVPFLFHPNAPTFARLSFTGNNLGGSVALSYPPLSNSLIDDQLADQRRAGKTYTSPSAGQQTVPLFSVTLDSLIPFTGTSCTVVTSGKVAGLSGGVTQATFLIGRSAGDPTVAQVGSQTSTVSFTEFYAITATPVPGTAQVTISTVFTPTDGGSLFDAQIRCMGGTYAVARM